MTFSSFLRGIIYFSLAIIPALAWFVSESTFFPFITGKNFGFRILVELSLISWVILALIEPAYRPKRSIVFYSYSIFLVVMFMANILGASPYFSFFSNYERMEGWFTHLHLFFYFTILYSVYKVDKDWLRMFGWFAVSNIAITLEGLLQILGQREFFITRFFPESLITFINTSYPTHMGNGLRLDSTLGNAAYYGIYTLFFVFIFSLMAFKANKWKGKQSWSSGLWIMISALLVCSENFIVTYVNNMQTSNQSLSGLLSVFSSFIWLLGIAGVIYFGYEFVKKYAEGHIGSYPLIAFALFNAVQLMYTQTRGSQIGLVVGLIVSATLIAIFGRAIGSSQTKKFSNVAYAVLGTIAALAVGLVVMANTTSGNAIIEKSIILKRITTIKLANIVLHPITSIQKISDEKVLYPQLVEYFGEATIVSRFLNAKMSIEGWSETTKTKLLGYGQENYGEVFAKHYDARMYDQEAWFDRAHNVFMDWLVAGGILGLLAYLALYFTPIYMMWMGKGKTNIHVVEKSLLTGTLVAYFVHNIFVFDNLISYIIFVALIAYIASRTRDTDRTIIAESKVHTQLPASVIYGVAAVTVLLVGALSYFTVYRPLSANLEIIGGLRSAPRSYGDLATTTLTASLRFKNAINSKSFGTTEANEQMIQQAAQLSTIDMSNLPADGSKASTTQTVQDFISYADTQFAQLVKNNPTVRNTSTYGSFLRQAGQTDRAVEQLAMAYKGSPTKQTIGFEYLTALVQAGKINEAKVVAENIYAAEPTFARAKEVLDSINKEIASSTKAVIKKR